MHLFATVDLIALGCFVGAWIAYAVAVEWTPHGRDSLNAHMDRYREIWMRRMLHREARMVDMQIMTALQNGTAFFASTSLIAIGGTLSLLRSTEEILSVMGALPLTIPTSREQWEAKTIGLVIMFAYAFFKFAWSYRLYNYVAILLGAMPLLGRQGDARGRRPYPPHRAALPVGRPALQPRPARLLPGDRLSRLVRRPLRADGVDRRRHRGDVAAAVRVGVAAGGVGRLGRVLINVQMSGLGGQAEIFQSVRA